MAGYGAGVGQTLQIFGAARVYQLGCISLFKSPVLVVVPLGGVAPDYHVERRRSEDHPLILLKQIPWDILGDLQN